MRQDKLEKLVLSSAAGQADAAGMQALWNGVSERMFSLQERQRELGLGEKVRLWNWDPGRLAGVFKQSKR